MLDCLKESTINCDRRDLWFYVNYKMKYVFHRHHVFAVMSILFEEMAKDLMAGKEIEIYNFGSLFLKEMPSRKHFHVYLKKVVQSEGVRKLRISILKRISKKLCQALDLDAIIAKGQDSENG